MSYLAAELPIMDNNEGWFGGSGSLEKPFRLGCLIALHIIICCVSLVCLSRFTLSRATHRGIESHLLRRGQLLPSAALVIAAFALVALPFVFVRFSFGYLVGFYLYTMVLGYLWLCFSDSSYNHRLVALSAALSAIAFLFPSLMIVSPIRQVYSLSTRSFEHLLTLILLVAVAAIVLGAIHHFRFVAVADIYDFRDKIELSRMTTYLIGITTGALLPFAFACFIERRQYWRAGLSLLLAGLFYPITLSKLALFIPAWLGFIALLVRIFGTRTSVILSLLLPTLAGVLIFSLDAWPGYFYTVNFRMLAVPSAAMEFYNDYFTDHDLTYFCQIGVLKPLMTCPYAEQLSVVMDRAYHLGNYNASMFATEGIASVGPALAPISMFVCGLVIAFANRLSCGLPPRFILVSGAILPQVLLSVPLTVTLLTHGAALLFLLWYVMPRDFLEQDASQLG